MGMQPSFVDTQAKLVQENPLRLVESHDIVFQTQDAKLKHLLAVEYYTYRS